MPHHHLPSLYLITDRRLVAAGEDFLEVLEALMVAGVRMIQLREKDLPAGQLYEISKNLRDISRRHDCLLLINDRIDIALAVDADGVHLRTNSLPLSAARALLGNDKIIGISTHSQKELTCADEQGADFATFGPVFFTPSKAGYGAPVGLSALREGNQAVSIPVYALGGITITNTPATMTTGAHGVAVVSSLMAAKDPATACQKLISAIGHR